MHDNNNNNRSPGTAEHSALAFYGIETDLVPIADMLAHALNWLREARCEPHLMGTDLDRKLIRFRNSEKKARKADFATSSFTLISLSDGAKEEWQGEKADIIYSTRSQKLVIDFESST